MDTEDNIDVNSTSYTMVDITDVFQINRESENMKSTLFMNTTFQNNHTKDVINNKCHNNQSDNNLNNEENESGEIRSEEEMLMSENDYCKVNSEKIKTEDRSISSPEPSHHARRPMNAFLIFCKRHRAVVRERYPHLENRAVTRILGEWWANLEEEEKSAYIALAKQYKDAFFNANPNFKWYKLPAPPLRTLTTRPNNYIRSTCPSIASENDSSLEIKSEQSELNNFGHHLNLSGFTPGKLADETQMGSLSSLIDPNYNTVYTSDEQQIIKSDQISEQTNNRSQYTPLNALPSSDQEFPPKPPKKRFTDSLPNTNRISNVSRNIFKDDKIISVSSTPQDSPFENLRNHALSSTQTIQERKLKRLHKTKRHKKSIEQSSGDSCDDEDDDKDRLQTFSKSQSNNMTQQELINRIVDHSMCLEAEDMSRDEQNARSKSSRTCKGKRYAEFMTEGRLVVNKRNKKSQNKIIPNTNTTQEGTLSYNTNLTSTIKKLTVRTKNNLTPDEFSNSFEFHTNNKSPPFRDRTCSETSDDSITKKMFRAEDFNLDEKIEALPSLSLEKFQQKKKESKKRKKIAHISVKHSNNNNSSSKHRPEEEHYEDHSNFYETNNNSLVGSRKRKARKESITHIEPITSSNNNANPDLSNLATLAEVAVLKLEEP